LLWLDETGAEPADAMVPGRAESRNGGLRADRTLQIRLAALGMRICRRSI
jgi:hypothetical protein